MKCIFWNTNNLEKIDVILEIAKDLCPDLFFLSEIDKQLLEDNEIKLSNIGYQYFINPGCERVSILKRNGLEIDLALQNKYYSTIKIKESDIYIVSIHLPSQMFQHMEALKEFIRNFRTEIDVEIGNSLEKRILIIGDFNISPYEKPMIDFDGFVATNSINSRKEITHLEKSKASYYNPTWQLYSRKHFPGTKFYRRPSSSSYDILEHHYLDQVVLSRCLLDSIVYENIEVIECSKNFRFFHEETNSLEWSDHLPLMYEFKIK